ncbi:hypothetical protein CAOG_06574 [Capsaspora owczarzaki ATCC 30864]|uniref:V-type proton ATPase subunit S1/VOA1 transmembrane domain-containing protein n=1 Tax=Capsaspora owczarzaki (strain ATCC 30864) TaxID=595528 RepID=A0A0D2X4K5_CAPO3|nr:hypothetical protein CAOG_06574 [Capsaspora owczarzaki ATCC 30864]KJE96219.1 hypothetical protein CAOG_006574 [Capsaspora owczarzaki ATCC 30864]|eukprot:XP_004345323.1 hypothetical protein CAOG_06574 [Capsaspora owczarzaki ATCC 30864]
MSAIYYRPVLLSSATAASEPQSSDGNEALVADHTTLDDVLLPGTHNSATNAFDQSELNILHSGLGGLRTAPIEAATCGGFRARDFVIGWSVNQDIGVLEQLEHGVRCLDIDVAFDLSRHRPGSNQHSPSSPSPTPEHAVPVLAPVPPDATSRLAEDPLFDSRLMGNSESVSGFHTLHSFRCLPLEHVLRDIARFCTAHPREIVLVAVELHEHNQPLSAPTSPADPASSTTSPAGRDWSTPHLKLARLIEEVLGSRAIPLNARFDTLRQHERAGRSIVLMCNSQSVQSHSALLWPANLMRGRWLDTSNPERKLEDLAAQMVQYGQDAGPIRPEYAAAAATVRASSSATSPTAAASRPMFMTTFTLTPQTGDVVRAAVQRLAGCLLCGVFCCAHWLFLPRTVPSPESTSSSNEKAKNRGAEVISRQPLLRETEREPFQFEHAERPAYRTLCFPLHDNMRLMACRFNRRLDEFAWQQRTDLLRFVNVVSIDFVQRSLLVPLIVQLNRERLVLPVFAAASTSAPLLAWSSHPVFLAPGAPAAAAAEPKSPLAAIPALRSYLNPDTLAAPSVVVVFVQNAFSSQEVARFGGFHVAHSSVSNIRALLQSSTSSLATEYSNDATLVAHLSAAATGKLVELSSAQLAAAEALPFTLSGDGQLDVLIVRVASNAAQRSEQFSELDQFVGHVSRLVAAASNGDYLAVFTSDKLTNRVMQTSFASDVLRRDVNDTTNNTWWTIPILMGLFVGAILFSILLTGVISIFTTETPTKFDDAKIHKGLQIKQ